MAINTSNNKVRIISTTVGLANSSKYTEINSPALVVNTSDGGIFYADGTAKNPFKQLAALPSHSHSDYLPKTGGTVTGELHANTFNIKKSNFSLENSGTFWIGVDTDDGQLFRTDKGWYNSYRILDSSNYTAFCPSLGHTHSNYATTTQLGNYLQISGGTMTGDIAMGSTSENTITTNKIDSGFQELTHKNKYGYIALGPFNADHAHIYTDRNNFYFNKTITVNGTPVSLEGHTHSNYLPKAGGTLTGSLTLPGDKYQATAATEYAIDMSNSDIVNLNAIYTCDTANSANEGFQFKRDNGNYDSIWAANGVFYFSPDGSPVGGGSYSNNYTVYHSGNLNLSNYLKKENGIIYENIHISGNTSSTVNYSSTNPKLIFSEQNDQHVAIVYNNHDVYRSPAGLKICGSQGGEWFEVDGSCYAKGFYKLNGTTTTSVSYEGHTHTQLPELHINKSYFSLSNSGTFWIGVDTADGQLYRTNNGWTASYRILDSYNYTTYCASAGHTHSGYLPKAGGTMTGNISYQGSKQTYEMIRFINNTTDVNGNGISIGGGGATIIGGGESASVAQSLLSSGGDERMIICNDADIEFFSNCQGGIGSRQTMTFNTSGHLKAKNFITDSDRRLKTNIHEISSDKLLDALNVNFYEFDYKDNDKHSAGHIAQEVKELLPEFVHGEETETEHLSIDYTGLHSIQIKALIEENNIMKKEIKELKELIKTLINEK